MGQIILPYPGGQHLRLTGSTVALTFDGRTPVTYPQDIRRETILQGPGGPTTLTFADVDGNTWAVVVNIPTYRTLVVDPSASEVAAVEDGGSL